MSMKIDYTPVSGLSALARRSGQVKGQWNQAELDLQRARMKQQAEQEQKAMALRAGIEAAKIRQDYAESAYSRRADAQERQDKLAQNEIENQLNERKQEFAEGEPERQLREAIAQRDAKREQFKWEYSETQKREIDKIQNAIADVRQRVGKDLTPDEARSLEEQLWMKQNGILPIKRYDDSMSANEAFEKSKIMNPDGSYSGMYVSSKGEPEIDPVYKARMDEDKAKAVIAQKEKEARAKMYVELATKTKKSSTDDEVLVPQFSDEEINQIIDKAFGVKPEEKTVDAEAQKSKGVIEKPLDEATARQILQEAGGDKDKARQIAKQRGYSF